MLWNACITLMKELTSFSSLYLGFFMSVLHAFLSSFEYHLNSLILISLLCLFWDSLLYCLAFCGNQLFELFLSQFNWLLPHDAGSGCGGILEQITNSFISFLFMFTCPLLLYSSFANICSVRVFRQYLLVLIGLLTCI